MDFTLTDEYERLPSHQKKKNIGTGSIRDPSQLDIAEFSYSPF
jgi:hypothetical protein